MNADQIFSQLGQALYEELEYLDPDADGGEWLNLNEREKELYTTAIKRLFTRHFITAKAAMAQLLDCPETTS